MTFPDDVKARLKQIEALLHEERVNRGNGDYTRWNRKDYRKLLEEVMRLIGFSW
jgi:hypothetical protein